MLQVHEHNLATSCYVMCYGIDIYGIELVLIMKCKDNNHAYTALLRGILYSIRLLEDDI